MRHTANFFLLVSSFLVMVQGFKSEQPSQLRERNLAPGRSTNCDFCIRDKNRKDLFARDATHERSRLERGLTNKEVLREMTVNPERRLYPTRDEVRTRSNRVSEDRRRDEDKTVRQFVRRERESNSYRSDDNTYDRRREERVVELKNERERKSELRSENGRDESRVGRIHDRYNDIRNIQPQENQELRSQRRVRNNLDEARDATGFALRDTKQILTDVRKLDGKQPLLARQPVKALKLSNPERMQERMSKVRGEDADKKQRRVGERNKNYRSIERRHISTSRLREISSRRKENIPFSNRGADHSEEREFSRLRSTDITRGVSINQMRSSIRNEERNSGRFSDNVVRNEQLSMVQRRELTESRKPSPTLDDNRHSGKIDNRRRTSPVLSSRFSDTSRIESSSQRDLHRRLGTDNRLLSSRRDNSQGARSVLSDTRRVESSSQTDRYQRQSAEDSRRERRQQRTRASRRRGESSLYYRVDDKLMDGQRTTPSIDLVPDQNRGKFRDIDKRLDAIRQITTHDSNSLSDTDNLNKARKIEVIALPENEHRDRRNAKENLDVAIQGKRKEYRLDSRIDLVQPDSRSQGEQENRRNRHDYRSVPSRLNTDRDLHISSLALKTRCLNRHPIDRDDGRRNGNVAFTDGRMEGLKRSMDERRRNIADRDVNFRETSLKHRTISDTSTEVVETPESWRAQSITFDGWSVTRAIVVGFVGIMGRSLWQKQI